MRSYADPRGHSNSATLVKSAKASRQRSYHVPGQVYDTAVGTTGRKAALSMDVGTLVTRRDGPAMSR